MIISQKFLLSVSVLLGAFHLLTIAKPANAAAITITPNPPTREVIENESGSFNFTIKNISNNPVTILDLRLPNASDSAPLIPFPIFFRGGDMDDKVVRTQIINEERCESLTLGINGTCEFQQLFETNDPTVSDMNFGLWIIFNTVIFREESVGVGATNGRANVVVKDPGVIIPEPSSTLGLLALGTLGAGSTLLRKQKQQKSAIALTNDAQ